MSNMGFEYRQTRVMVPSSADVPSLYRFGSRLDWAVKQALESLKPWGPADFPMVTVKLDRMVPAIVVPVGASDCVTWAIHKGHKRKDPQVSPFVKLGHEPMVRDFTIEMTRTPAKPVLVRAYPGTYIPPLPWMGRYREPRQYSIEFWSTHAYVHRSTLIASPESDEPPDWYQR